MYIYIYVCVCVCMYTYKQFIDIDLYEMKDMQFLFGPIVLK